MTPAANGSACHSASRRAENSSRGNRAGSQSAGPTSRVECIVCKMNSALEFFLADECRLAAGDVIHIESRAPWHTKPTSTLGEELAEFSQRRLMQSQRLGAPFRHQHRLAA